MKKKKKKENFPPVSTTSSCRTKATEIPSCWNRLFHQVGRSRTTHYDHRKEHKRVRVEGNHMQVWNPQDFHIWQWKTVWQLTFPRILWRTWHTQPLLIPRSPAGQWTGGSHKSILAQDDQDSTWGGKRVMVWRAPKYPMGIQDDSKNSHQRNSISTGVRHWSRHTNRNWTHYLEDEPLWWEQ